MLSPSEPGLLPEEVGAGSRRLGLSSLQQLLLLRTRSRGRGVKSWWFPRGGRG